MEATGKQKVHYGRVFNWAIAKKARATASTETCGMSWSLLSNEFVFGFVLVFFFSLASNKMSAQLKLFLLLGQHSKGQRAVWVPLVNAEALLLWSHPGGVYYLKVS